MGIPSTPVLRAIVTGANTGLGYYTAHELAARGYEIILAVRNTDRGWQAKKRILADVPGASLHVVEVDLASLASVREFAAHVAENFGSWNVLVNNGGAILTPTRQLTPDRFELQFGTNHLGHFALTGLLLPQAAPKARIVTVYSLSYRWASIRFHDLRWDHGYTPMRAYSMSKLANLLFARELDRKAKREGLDVSSVAVHPGYAVEAGPDDPLSQKAWALFASGLAVGGDALVFAATDPSLTGGEAVGPGTSFQLKGEPTVLPTPRVRNEEAIAHRLWLVSGQLTRVPW